MKGKYLIGLDGSGIDEFWRGIEKYQRWLNEKAQELVLRLTQEGYEVARAGFENAVYDGTNDFSVSVEERGENARAVVAIGSTVLFVEFGTGITYPDNHPEAAKHGMGRGEYGKGHGKQRTWGYYGEDPGTNGVFATKKNGALKEPHVVLTHGNPANMPMYGAARQLEQDFGRIAREVFGGD